MASQKNNMTAIIAILLAVASLVYGRVQSQASEKELQKLCYFAKGTYTDGACHYPSRGDSSGGAAQIISYETGTCPQGQFLSGISSEGRLLCRGFDGLSKTNYSENDISIEPEVGDIGGWRYLEICEGTDLTGSKPVCDESRQTQNISKCEVDVSPAYVNSTRYRYTIPVPCIDRRKRCYVDEGQGRNAKRVIYKCDNYQMLKMII